MEGSQLNQILANLANSIQQNMVLHSEQTKQQQTLNHQIAEMQLKLVEAETAHASARNNNGNRLRMIPEYMLFDGKQKKPFHEHIQQLQSVRLLQNLDDDDFIKTIFASFTSDALKIASTIKVQSFLNRANGSGSEAYIKELERLFVTPQQSRSARIDFVDAKQKKGTSIQEFYGNLLHLAKVSGSIEDPNTSRTVKDRFVEGLLNPATKRWLMQTEDETDSLQALLQKANKSGSYR